MKHPKWEREPDRSTLTLPPDPITGESVSVTVIRVGGLEWGRIGWMYWSDLLGNAYPDKALPTRTSAEHAAITHVLALTGRCYRALLALRRET